MSEQQKQHHENYWSIVWNQFKNHRLGYISLYIVGIMALLGVYAPLLASSQPLVVRWNGEWFFPLFRYLFYTGFYTKRIDIFYNVLMFSLPLGILFWRIKFDLVRKSLMFLLIGCHFSIFIYFGYFYAKDPASTPELNQARFEAIQAMNAPVDPENDRLVAPLKQHQTWDFRLKYLNDYGKLQKVLKYYRRKKQDTRLQQYRDDFRQTALDRWLVRAVVDKRQKMLIDGVSYDDIPESKDLKKIVLQEIPDEVINEVTALPTLWHLDRQRRNAELEENQQIMALNKDDYLEAKALIDPLLEKCESFGEQTIKLEREREEMLARIEKIENAAGGEGNLRISDQLREKLQEMTKDCESIRTASDAARGKISDLRRVMEKYVKAEARVQYLMDKENWFSIEENEMSFILSALFRDFHWEDDAGGEQNLNRFLPWYERTRTNRKDLVAGLLFGIRISMVVGILAVSLAALIGIPIGAVAGYYGGKFDIIVSRLLEIWESMPTFFMLLLVVAITQSKSIFLVIGVIGLFGWTGFSRYIRGEVFKQRNLAYIEACQAMGFRDRRIIFSHILPNAIPPLLTLLPFAIMGAITSEAGLSFLGLGEEGSCSWGVLMDEGRNAFPGESYLLWPPAILLTLLLVAIALVGDALRDSLDPKLRR